MVPDLVCLRGCFREGIGEDELGLERGGDGEESFVAVLPFRLLVKKKGWCTR